MKGNSYVVACMAASVSAAPVCAFRLRPPPLATIASIEAFLANAIRTGDGAKLILWTVAACAAFGFIIGLIIRDQFGPAAAKKEFEPTFIRSPISAFLLIPTAVAAIILVAANWTPKAADQIVWPSLYFNFIIPWSIPIGILGSAAAELLNDYECVYEKSKPAVRFGICSCWPLAVIVGGLVILGLLAIGLFIGLAIGLKLGCPLLAVWLGTAVAALCVAFVDDVFWPVYYPMTRLSTT